MRGGKSGGIEKVVRRILTAVLAESKGPNSQINKFNLKRKT